MFRSVHLCVKQNPLRFHWDEKHFSRLQSSSFALRPPSLASQERLVPSELWTEI